MGDTRRGPISRILFPGLPRFDDHSSRAPVARRSLAANPDLLGPKQPCDCSRAVPIWHCSRWGLPCRPCCQVRGGLLPHRFTLTFADKGGLFSVALSLGFPRPGVTRHRCLVESGLSSRANAPAAIRPSAQGRCRAKGGAGQWKGAGCGTAAGDQDVRRVTMRASSASCGPLAQGRNLARKALRASGMSVS